MRAWFLLVPLLAASAPAFAQSRAAPPAIDPATVDRLVDHVQSISQALLNVRLGELQAAAEGREATPDEKRLTVGDLGRRNDPDFDRHLGEHIAAAKPAIERSIHAVKEALPEITHDLQQAQDAVQRAIANMPDPNYPRR